MRRNFLPYVIAPLTTALVCAAQEPPQSVDEIANWSAPLYWQPSPSHAVQPNHGRIREEAAVRQAVATLGNPAVFVAMSPCRVVDTRSGNLPFGAPAFASEEIRTIPLATSTDCAIPATAVAYSLNIAVVPIGTTMRWLTAWDTGSPQPNSSTLNDKAGLITSNSAIVPAGTSGSINVFVKDATNVTIDINGYYAAGSTLAITGTAESPGLTFGDTTTGLYSDTAGTVSIATGGTSRLTVRADGDLELPGSIRKGGVLFAHTLGTHNTALGLGALATSGTNWPNTAIGYNALTANNTGYYNTSVGSLSMTGNTAGYQNTAVGRAALWNIVTGCCNTAVGFNAGSNTMDGSYNIYMANQGPGVTESNTTRIGDTNQLRTFISGIRGVTTGNADAVAVVIDSAGQLGTASSSRRVKRDIHDMADTTATIMNLHPVQFRYTAHGPDSPLQYGLIAEEVAEIAPDLVARNKDGEIETVHYDKVNAMLLNEVQKLHREVQQQRKVNQDLESRLVELESRVK